MNKQVNKVFGLLALGVGGVVVSVWAAIFHVLPAFLVLSFFSLVLSSIVYFITLQIFNFKILWLVFTIILGIGVLLNFNKIEYDIRKSVLEDEEE